MKKVGYFCASFLPFIIALGLQFVAPFFLYLVIYIVKFLPQSADGITSELWSDYLSILLETNTTAVASILFSVMAIVIFGLTYYYKFEGKFLENPKNYFNLKLVIGLLLIVPVSQMIASYIVMGVTAVNPQWLTDYQEMINKSGKESYTLPVIIYSIIMAPIGEELIFRGVTLRSARRAVPFWAANILQAFLFGCLHGNMIQGSFAFTFGLLLGYVCERYGKIYYSMLLHIGFNILGETISLIINENSKNYVIGIYYLVVLITAIAGVILLKKGKKELRNRRAALNLD